MEKELLKKRHIIHDLKTVYYQNLFATSVMMVLAFAMYFLAARTLGKSKFILLFVLIALSVYLITFIVIGLIKVSTGNFTIVSDRVIKKLDKRLGLSRFTLKRPYTLVFSKYGRYGIPGENYTWSKQFKQSDMQFYRTTNLNDEFYIVRIGKFNSVAYSKNFFTTEDYPSII